MKGRSSSNVGFQPIYPIVDKPQYTIVIVLELTAQHLRMVIVKNVRTPFGKNLMK